MSILFSVELSLGIKELLVVESSRNLHHAMIKAHSLGAPKVQSSVKLGHNFTGWNHKSCLVDLFISFESRIQLSIGVVVIRIDAWDKVVLTCLDKLL